jgi:hypothetical protein
LDSTIIEKDTYEDSLRAMIADRDAANARAEKAERKLCAAREWMVLAKTLNGTECTYHDGRRRRRIPNIERCGKCLYCVIDYALAVHLASSPCRHESALAELRGRINVEGMGDFIRYWLAKHCTKNLERNALAAALRDHLMGKEKG